MPDNAHQLGREQGRLDEKRAIANNQLAVLDDAAIATITGLTVDDVQKQRNA